MKLEMAAASHVGRVRERNEDCVLVRPDLGIALLADGLGGHNAGDVASKMAIKITSKKIQALLKKDQWHRRNFKDIIKAANERIRTSAKRKPWRHGMATTLVATLFKDQYLHYGHVGDSRLYVYRNHQLDQITQDHTLAQEYIDSGLIQSDDSNFAIYNSMLSKSLGTSREIDPASGHYSLQKADIFLLCSDGLSDYVKKSQIAGILADATIRLYDTADRLIKLALRKGGADNISIVLVRIKDLQ